jgi:acyl carrier protein
MRETIFLQVQCIFRAFFRNQEIEITDNTTTDDIALWDSLTHLELMNEIENHYSINFTLDEILDFQNVGNMIDCIQIKSESK